MRVINNFENIQASNGDFERPTPGGYICIITNAVDVPFDANTSKGDYLKIEYDIAFGNLKGYYSEAYKKFGGTWWANFIRSYKDSMLPAFKHFTNCLEESNANYKWSWDEHSLRGKYIGIVLGEEEYEKTDGTIATRLYVKDVKNVIDIEAGNYQIPELKKLKRTATSDSMSLPKYEDCADELPFA